VPLHTSPFGLNFGYEPQTLPVTESISERLLRLPLYAGMSTNDVDDVIREIYSFYGVRP
jgi:dTDP-4-amino-4,6-dideoxygalactose transaminase